MSIWTWKERGVAHGVAQTVVQVVTHPAKEAASWTAVWLPILMMYSPVQVVCTALAISFMLAPAAFAAAFWVGSLAVYYAVTLPGAPEHTGAPSTSLTALLSCMLAGSLTHIGMHALMRSLRHAHMHSRSAHSLAIMCTTTLDLHALEKPRRNIWTGLHHIELWLTIA